MPFFVDLPLLSCRPFSVDQFKDVIGCVPVAVVVVVFCCVCMPSRFFTGRALASKQWLIEKSRKPRPWLHLHITRLFWASKSLRGPSKDNETFTFSTSDGNILHNTQQQTATTNRWKSNKNNKTTKQLLLQGARVDVREAPTRAAQPRFTMPTLLIMVSKVEVLGADPVLARTDLLHLPAGGDCATQRLLLLLLLLFL